MLLRESAISDQTKIKQGLRLGSADHNDAAVHCCMHVGASLHMHCRVIIAYSDDSDEHNTLACHVQVSRIARLMVTQLGFADVEHLGQVRACIIYCIFCSCHKD